jgi:copper oxidase (laccase) domain-containing protein
LSETPVLTARNLALPGVGHAFFTRQGGVSDGVYASLNGGVGSRDASEKVAENRARMAKRLGVPHERLLVPFQIHSADALIVSEPWEADSRPRCDGLVTREKNLALGVTGADCGWKGALTGMIDATVSAMETLGAQRAHIHVALGPAIGATSYEVGPEFSARFVETDTSYARFFTPSTRADHAMFNLPGFIAARVSALGVASFENLGVDTYADDARCYSYRRSVHRNEPDYGRLVSAITLL